MRFVAAGYLLIILFSGMPARLSGAEDAKGNNFSFVARMHYNSAVANGIASVNVLVAAKMGATQQAIDTFQALGGKALERYDAIGYFWGNIPTKRLPDLLASPEITDFQLDGERGSLVEYYPPTDPKTLKPDVLWDRRIKPAADDDQAPSTKLPELSAQQLDGPNPYLPWDLIGLPDFEKQHQTFDGRGVTVAVVGYGIGDLSHPAMQKAMTIDGKPISKVAGILDVPRTENDLYAVRLIAEEPPALPPQYLELKMDQPLRSDTSSATNNEKTFALPAPGDYRIGQLDHGGRSFQVLWSPSQESVWVDTNQNNRFDDEKELKDVNREFRFGVFPPETAPAGQPAALAMSFAITIDKGESTIRFFLAENFVGDASVVAGNGFLGSAAGGVAPNARILYVPIGQPVKMTSYHQVLKAFIYAAERPDVDVVEGGAFIVNPPFYGQTVTSLILDRIATVYGKAMFFIEGDMGGGSHVLGIRDYLSAGNWRKLYGVDAPLRDNTVQSEPLNALNGVSKPDFLMPDSIYATSCNLPAGSEPRTFRDYAVPRCYGIIGSQSMPVAAAAGMAADLISAAKQTGAARALDRIEWALRAGAKYLDQMEPNPVRSPGYGLGDIGSSWRLLSGAEPTPDFSVSSQSHGRLEDYSRTPHVGEGLNEFFGVHPGSTGAGQVTITRSSGAADALSYRLVWRGNDGTFTVPATVNLPLNQPVSIPIGYAPKTAGLHRAMLQIEGSTGAVAYAFLNTVIASTPLGADNKSVSWSPEGKGIPLSHEQCGIFDVQPDVASLNFHMTLPGGGALTQIFSSPLLGPEWYLRRTVDAPESHTTTFDNEDSARYALFSHPPAGPWAFCVVNPQLPARAQKKVTIPYTLPAIRLDALTANVKLDGVKADAAASAGRLEIHNEGAAMKRAVVHVRLGYDDRHSVTIGPAGSTTEIDADVADGTQVLLFRIHGAEKASGLAAMIYNCADFASDPQVFRPPACRFQDFRERPEFIEYRLPHEGKWKLFLYRMLSGDDTPVQVDVIQVPAGDQQKPLEKIPNQDDQVGEGLAARRALAKVAGPVKIEGVQQVGTVAENAQMEQTVHLDKTTKRTAGVPVAVTELYDLAAEDNAAEFMIKMYPFDPTHSRPIAVGLDVTPLSGQDSNVSPTQ